MMTHLSRRVCQAAAITILTVGLSSADAGAATLFFSGPHGATVHLGDMDLGLLPMDGPIELPPGIYFITCRARGYRDLSKTVVLSEADSRMHIHLRPQPLVRKHAVTSSLLYAGLGQWYTGTRYRGWVYFLGQSSGLLWALTSELQRQNHRDDYLVFKDRYDHALLQPDIEKWRSLTEQAYQDMQDMTSRRNTGLYVAAGSWVLSLLDSWLLFPVVDIGPGMVPPVAGVPSAQAGLHACLALRF